MRYKNLGKSKIKVSSIGLGTNFVANIQKNGKKLVFLLKEAADKNINFFDTAEIYHGGYSEILLGKAFSKMRDKVFIATKFSPQHSNYKDVLKAAEGSLKRLQTDYIDLYQIHWPNPMVAVEETLRALEKLIKKGKARFIGLSNYSLRQLKEIRKISKLPIISLQAEYNLLERSIEHDLLPYTERNNIFLIAYTPLNSGSILKTEKYVKFFSNLSKKYNKTPSQIILNFLTAHPTVITIPATTNLSHLTENSQATDFVLEKGDLQLIAKKFTTKIIKVDTSKIRMPATNHDAYKNIKEALDNKLNFFPSPKVLSEDIRKGDFLKPVRVRAMQRNKGNFEYELLGGRIRYWAWIIAYNGKKPIPAIVED